MNKIYSRINWENYPSDATPVNEANLNKIDAGLDGVDNRMIEQDAIKASREEISDLVREWKMDEATGIITITKVNGEQVIFDLNIEKIPVSFSLSSDGILTMTTEDGTAFTANIGAMIPVLVFRDSDTVAVNASGSGINKTYSFAIKEGSVTEDKLQPDFLADIKLESAKAESSANVSGTSAAEAGRRAEEAKSYSVGGTGTREGEDTDNARYYMEQAKAIVGGEYVTGIKGEAEMAYRTGNVELSPENLGLGNVENKTSAAIRSEITSQNVADALGYVPANQSTAITTGNIAQQSVKYAESAKTATKVGSASVGNANTPVYLNNGTITSTGKSFADYLPISGGTMTGRPTMPAIELSSGSPFIDFHYGGSSEDYTSRIIETGKGTLLIAANETHFGTGNAMINSAGHFLHIGGIVLRSPGTFVNNYAGTAMGPIHASAFDSASSQLVKENISEMTEEEARKLLQVEVVDFDYKEQFGGETGQHGVIAEDILPLIPSCVTVPENYSEEEFDLEKGIQNKVLSVDYSKLVPYLIKLVQLQQKQIDECREKLGLQFETV